MNRRLYRMMRKAFDTVCTAADEHEVSLRIGVHVLGVPRVAEVLRMCGSYA